MSAPRPSAPALKSRRERAEAPTLPPPRAATSERVSHTQNKPDGTSQGPTERDRDDIDGRPSGVRSRRPARPSMPAATVDEVVADLSKDPRHERNEEE
jgi:hypothetical protein